VLPLLQLRGRVQEVDVVGEHHVAGCGVRGGANRLNAWVPERGAASDDEAKENRFGADACFTPP
jgi:hypothetical protein